MKLPPPIVDAPGAGLPPINAFFARYFIFPIAYRMSSVPSVLEEFQSVGQRILSDISELNESQLNKRVLIFPINGLEDSSRNWSIAETLEHLIVTHTGMAQIAESLMGGVVPPIQISTATVKPLGRRKGREAVQSFRQLLEERLKMDQRFLSLRHGGPALFHPWFGNLCAREWIFLRTFHQRIHRRQIHLIRSSPEF